jgi:hypothetical protein
VVRRLLLLLALVGVLAACRVDVGVDLVIGADGTGQLTVTATADAEVVEQVPGLAADLRFDDAVAAGWVVEGPNPTDDGGLTVVLRHDVTSAADATNLLAGLGPPFADVRLDRTVSPDGDDTTLALTGQLTLPAGFDSFADADLLAAVGGTPFAEQLAASGATPAESMTVTFGADLAGEVEETTGQDIEGVLTWDAPLDGTALAVTTRTVDRPAEGGGWADAVSTIALVLLVLWLVVAVAFIVSVARARSRRAKARRLRRRQR